MSHDPAFLLTDLNPALTSSNSPQSATRPSFHKMKILMITPVLDSDDIFRGFLSSWVRHLAAEFGQMDIITSYSRNFPAPPNVKILAAQPAQDTNRFRQRIMTLLTILKYLWQEKPDFIFAHMNPVYILFAAPLAKLKRIPMILWYAHRGIYKRLKWAHQLADCSITASEESFRINSPKREIIGHGIDTELFVPANPPHASPVKKILSISRIAPIKRCDLILEGFIRLQQLHPEIPAQLIFIGDVAHAIDQPYLDSLKKRARDFGLEDKIKFLGKVAYSELVPHFQSCDLFLNASETGSIDKAVLEAMSCEKPILSCNEAFQQILSSVDASLFFNLITADEMASKMKKLLCLEEGKRLEIGRRLREITVRDHSVQQLPKKICSILEKIHGQNHC